MGRGSVKKFFEKQTTRTFKLVPRSVGDSGEGAGERVFVEVTPGAERIELENLGDAFVDVEEFDEDEDEPLAPAEPRVGEAAKYGVLFDDRVYDYTQHLRTVGQVPGSVLITAPVEPKIREEEYMEEIRRLDKAVYDDIKAVITDDAVLEVFEALEDEAYVDEEAFEDDIVGVLDRETPETESEEIDITGDFDDEAEDWDMDEIMEEYDENSDYDMDADENDKEKIIMAAAIESENEVENDGPVDRNILKARARARGFAQVDELRKALLEDGSRLRLPSQSSESDFDENEMFSSSSSDDDQDAITAAIVLSSTANRPRMLSEIKISKKTGLPIIPNAETITEEPSQPADNKGVPRQRKESKEEKKARKVAVKEERRERRAEKKENRVAYSKSILV